MIPAFFVVTYYEIKYSNVAADLIESNFNYTARISERNVAAGSLRPHEAGAPQSVVLLFPNVVRNMPYYVALRAVDKANKTSKVSNMAAFFVAQKIEEIYRPVLESAAINEVNISEDIEPITEFDDMEETIKIDDSASSATIILIISITAGFILILGLASFLLILFLKRIRRTKPYHAITITPAI